METLKAVNWNLPQAETDETILRQNIKQFWTESEFNIKDDIPSWNVLSNEQQEAYAKVLSGLTLLDTRQGADGMSLIGLHVKSLHAKELISWMQMMEGCIHAKSYSHIFSTLLSPKRTNYLLGEWVENQPELQKKANMVVGYYHKLWSPVVSDRDLYMAMVASVFLESYLFYSGFFYPLYLAGHGKMIMSGQIISKIIRDEAIHGAYIGMLAQELREEMNEEEQESVNTEMYDLLEELFQNEMIYTQKIYNDIGLADEVEDYVKYNANRALQNLGFDQYFDHEPVNSVVLNGLNAGNETDDFFSVLSNYTVAVNIEELQDDDFDFSDVAPDDPLDSENTH